MSFSDLMDLNTSTYTVAIDATSKNAILNANGRSATYVELYNASTNAVFVASSVNGVAIVFPTSATVPLDGKVIAPGTTISFKKNPMHGFISAIQATAGTGSLFISVGFGE